MEENEQNQAIPLEEVAVMELQNMPMEGKKFYQALILAAVQGLAAHGQIRGHEAVNIATEAYYCHLKYLDALDLEEYE